MGLFSGWGSGASATETPVATTAVPATQQTAVPGTTTENQPTPSPLDDVAKFLTGGSMTGDDINSRVGKMFTMDPAKFDAQFEGRAFIKLTQDQLNTMKAGGDEATTTMLQIINDSVRDGIKEATRNAIEVTQHGLRASDGYVGERVEHTIARRTAADAVYDMGEQMSHPAMKAITDPLIAGLAREYPNATKAQLTEHAKGMMEKMMGGVGFERKRVAVEDPALAGSDFSDWVKP